MNYEIKNYNSVKEGLIDLKKNAMTIKQVMEARLKDDSLWKTWIDTRTFILYGKKGKFKITNKIDFDILNREINDNGSISISEKEYKECKSKEFDAKKLILNKDLTVLETLKHKCWLAFCEGDKDLLVRYINHAKMLNCFNDNGNGMGIYIHNENGDIELRPLYVGDSDCRSDAVGGSNFGSDGRFLRVNNSKPKNTEETKVYLIRLQEKLNDLQEEINKVNEQINLIRQTA